MNDNNEWRDVCHDGDDLFDQDWSINEAMVACRQLGYPGTAMKRKGGYGNGHGKSMDGIQCYGSEYICHFQRYLSSCPKKMLTHFGKQFLQLFKIEGKINDISMII